MLRYSCGNHGVLQLWNIAMSIHKIYSYNVTCTREVRISLSILGLFLKSQDSGIPWLKIWPLKIYINILKRNARGMFPRQKRESYEQWLNMTAPQAGKQIKRSFNLGFFSLKHLALQFGVLVAFVLYGACAFPKFFSEALAQLQNCRQGNPACFHQALW